MKKTKLAAAIALAVSGAVIAPQASAGDHKGMQAQINALSSMMKSMQKELKRVKSAGGAQSLQEWENTVDAVKKLSKKTHMASVRGGWMHTNNARGNNTNLANTGYGVDILTSEVDADAFYYGANFDYEINDDFFGLLPGAAFNIDFGIEYAELGERKQNGLYTLLNAVHGATVGGMAQQSVTVNMLRVNVSPKVKLSGLVPIPGFRPWIIPVGIDFNIISPPSDAITVLNTGMNFGAGAELDLLAGIVVGVDGRYHYTPDDIDGVDTDGFTLGGSVGFKF
jgi:opacity protein-like surface antigen